MTGCVLIYALTATSNPRTQDQTGTTQCLTPVVLDEHQIKEVYSTKVRSHVDSVCSTLSLSIYILRQLAKCFPTQVLMMACYGIFYPHLSYGVPLRGGYKFDLTFHPSKRSVRKISDLQWRDQCRPEFKSLVTLPWLFGDLSINFDV